MTFEDFRALAAPLAVQLGAEWDLPTWRLYHQAVASVPPMLLELAFQMAAETRTKYPSAAQLREIAESMRRKALALYPWSPCCECEDSPRWRKILVEGIERVEVCPCVRRHTMRLAEMGLGTPIAELPGEDSPQSERLYPTLEQLPADIRARLETLSAQKVLR